MKEAVFFVSYFFLSNKPGTDLTIYILKLSLFDGICTLSMLLKFCIEYNNNQKLKSK